MAVVFTEGFDKYGPTNITDPTAASLLVAGEWTSTSTYLTVFIVNGLSATGRALSAYSFASDFDAFLYKNLAATYTRLIGGFRFSTTLAAPNGLQFRYITAEQCTLSVQTNGSISLTRGGTTLANGGILTQNSTHYIEYDITFGTSSPYRVWLDGVAIFSGTGNTAGSGLSTTDGLALYLGGTGTPGSCTFDDMYLFDNTGTTNNSALLTSPRVETTFPTGESRTNFSNGGNILGQDYAVTNGGNTPGANTLVLRPFVAPVGMTLNSVSVLSGSTNPTANFKAVIYSDNAGVPQTLLSSGTQVTGCINGALLTGNLVTPQVLVTSTQYWIGFIGDSNIAFSEVDSSTTGQVASNTYASGAPATAPSMTINRPSWRMFGNATGATVNWDTQTPNPSALDLSYIYSSTVGNEDLYTFTPLSSTPAAIYVMGVKSFVRKTDTGARTVSLRTRSSTVDTAGNNPNQPPGTSYGWFDSYWETDPNTSTAWTRTTLNAAVSGPQVAS